MGIKKVLILATIVIASAIPIAGISQSDVSEKPITMEELDELFGRGPPPHVAIFWCFLQKDVPIVASSFSEIELQRSSGRDCAWSIRELMRAGYKVDIEWHVLGGKALGISVYATKE